VRLPVVRLPVVRLPVVRLPVVRLPVVLTPIRRPSAYPRWRTHRGLSVRRRVRRRRLAWGRSLHRRRLTLPRRSGPCRVGSAEPKCPSASAQRR
jgi:hypothetical protein